uniref:Uncharacterized protein n=1 Tax=Heterorhabditis bacteriophora TaxID=37862 RepID=A0A1I7WBJ7_HETBA
MRGKKYLPSPNSSFLTIFCPFPIKFFITFTNSVLKKLYITE